MVRKTPCPDASDLKRLLEGDLPVSEETGVSQHLDTCPSCQRQLQELAADEPSWGALAVHLKNGSSVRGTALQVAMEELRDDPLSLGMEEEIEEAEDDTFPFLDPPVKPRQLGKLDDYEIIEKIGRGGMGIVFKALDPGLHRIVAIKVMVPQFAALPSARQRFQREAKATAAVCHEHVVTVHAVSETKGLPYLVMQFVSGVSLQERLEKRGALNLDEILRIGMQTAQGLAAAHAQGLVHRDIKPANILLENGVERVKITDFGLARVASDSSLTQSGVIVGTPQYMAPEQARGEAVDSRADLFSLGSVLYFMCTGRAPFQGRSSLAVIRQVCDENPAPIQEINPNIPDWLAEIITRLQAKEPADRFSSASEVAERLNFHLLHEQRARSIRVAPFGSSNPASVKEASLLTVPLEPPKSRWGKWFALFSAASLLAIAGLIISLNQLGFFQTDSQQGSSEKQLTELADKNPKPQSGNEALTHRTHDASSTPPLELPSGPPGHEQTIPTSSDLIPSIPGPPLTNSRLEVQLSEPFTQVCTGGGGRYLIFHLKNNRKLAIFDVAVLKVVHEIELPTEDVIYACGRDKLMIVLPGQQIIQRYDLKTFQREKSAHVPDDRPARRVVMGSNSQGPLVLWTGGKVVFFDIESMERFAVEGAILSGDTQWGLELRVSADGQTIVGWKPGIYPMQYSVMRLMGQKAVTMLSPDPQSFKEHWAMPAADGSLVFRYGAGIYSGNMKILAADGFAKSVLLPTEDPRFFLALRSRPNDEDEVAICTTADRRTLLSVPNLEKLTSDRLFTRWGMIGGEPRVHYLPSAHVLVTLPESNDRVVIRPLDLFASLDREGRNYLYVLSVPRTRARAGTMYDYPLDIRSQSGGIHCQLEEGPAGMTVSLDGRLHWQVPVNQAEKSNAVIVTIRDASGKSIQHSFEITME